MEEEEVEQEEEQEEEEQEEDKRGRDSGLISGHCSFFTAKYQFTPLIPSLNALCTQVVQLHW